mgnify:CR=1 FL=1
MAPHCTTWHQTKRKNFQRSSLAGVSSQASVRAVPFASYPVHAGTWDGDAARLRLRKRASSDESGDWDKVDRSEYAKGFAYVAGDGASEADYKLPHHDVQGGELVTVPAGVQAAINAVQGARGGVEIPADELGAAKAHLAKEAEHALGEAPAWERSENASGEQPTLLDGIPIPRIGGDPPTRLLAFKWGANPTTKGTLYLTPEGAEKALSAFRKKGVRLCFDYYHSSYNPAVAPAERKGAGTCAIETDAEGLWYVDIQFTPPAAQAIRLGEWPYFSPAVLHDKAGVIYELKNPGLVTDPGTINARPLVLSEEGQPMADKKRAWLDAYSGTQTLCRQMQTIADTDGADKDLGNKYTGILAAMADEMRSHMKASGYASEAEAVEMSADRAKKAEKMLAVLEANLGETDPAKLEGKLMLKLLAAPAPQASASAEIDALRTALLDSNQRRYPAALRPKLEAMSPGALVTYLAGTSEPALPTEALREAAPAAPTVEQLTKDTQNMSAPTPAPSGPPTTLAACSPAQRQRVQTYVDMERHAMATAGMAFDETAATQIALTLLSDEGPTGNESRHLPLRTGDPVTTLEG